MSPGHKHDGKTGQNLHPTRKPIKYTARAHLAHTGFLPHRSRSLTPTGPA